MADHGLEVCRVESASDLRAFIGLPWKIYRGDAHWVPPLKRDVRRKLDRQHHPFFEHARMELFLARRGPSVVGRIAAVVDDRHNEFHHEKTGSFGMFECVGDYEAASALFVAAEKWCWAEGMTHLRGPLSLSMNDECGFLLEGFDSAPVLMMPYNPRYYLEFTERSGFVK